MNLAKITCHSSGVTLQIFVFSLWEYTPENLYPTAKITCHSSGVTSQIFFFSLWEYTPEYLYPTAKILQESPRKYLSLVLGSTLPNIYIQPPKTFFVIFVSTLFHSYLLVVYPESSGVFLSKVVLFVTIRLPIKVTSSKKVSTKVTSWKKVWRELYPESAQPTNLFLPSPTQIPKTTYRVFLFQITYR